MGLIKDTLEAVTRIDRNLAAIRKSLTRDCDDTFYRAPYLQKPVEPKGSTYNQGQTERHFYYPDHLTLGGRLRAVRLYVQMKQEEFADDLLVTPSYVSRLEADKALPSAMFVRSVSRRWSIDEHWLATGKLGTGDAAGEASETIKQCFQRAMKELEPEPPIKPTFSRSISGGVNLRLDSESGRDYSRSAQ